MMFIPSARAMEEEREKRLSSNPSDFVWGVMYSKGIFGPTRYPTVTHDTITDALSELNQFPHFYDTTGETVYIAFREKKSKKPLKDGYSWHISKGLKPEQVPDYLVSQGVPPSRTLNSVLTRRKVLIGKKGTKTRSSEKNKSKNPLTKRKGL